MNLIGAVHVMTVNEKILRPRWTYDEVDADIEHLAECPTYESSLGGLDHECAVGANLSAAGFDSFGDELIGLDPGTYPVQAWTETYHGFDYTEYDGGLTLVGDES